MSNKVFIPILVVLIVLGAVITGLAISDNKKVENENKKVSSEYDEVRQNIRDEIKKKNEEYNVYQKLKEGLDVNILVVGDQIGASAHSGVANNEDVAWTSRLSTLLRDEFKSQVKITNLSFTGTTSYYGYYKMESNFIDNNDTDYDLAIICYGQNENAKTVALDYEALVRTIKNNYENCEVVSILENTLKDRSDIFDTIKNISDKYSSPSVDMVKAFKNSELKEDDLVNGLLPTNDGYKLYSDTILETLKSKIDFTDKIGTLEKPLNEKANEYIKYKYLSIDDIEKDELSYSFHTTSNRIGLCYTVDYTKVTIFVDDKKVKTFDLSKYNHTGASECREILSNLKLGEKVIRLEFEDEDDMAKVSGFILNDLTEDEITEAMKTSTTTTTIVQGYYDEYGNWVIY